MISVEGTIYRMFSQELFKEHQIRYSNKINLFVFGHCYFKKILVDEMSEELTNYRKINSSLRNDERLNV